MFAFSKYLSKWCVQAKNLIFEIYLLQKGFHILMVSFSSFFFWGGASVIDDEVVVTTKQYYGFKSFRKRLEVQM